MSLHFCPAAVAIVHVTLRGGYALDGGGLFVTGGASVLLKHSAVVSNTAASSANSTGYPCGGGMFINHSSAGIETTLVAWNQAGDAGGGICAFGSFRWPKKCNGSLE